jgi:hypothetical protein
VRYLALLLLVPTLAFGQTYTAAQRNGLYKAAIDAAAWLRVQGNTPTVVGGTQLRFGGTVPATTPCARCTIYLDDDNIVALGLNPDAALFTGAFNRYGVLQICGPAVPLATRTYDPPRWLTDLLETCSKTVVTAAATWPVAIIAHRTDATAQTVATGFSTACSTGANCNWTPPLQGGGVGASTAAPLGVTLPAGLWSGAGCRLKSARCRSESSGVQ